MSELSLSGINKVYPGNVQAVFDFDIEVEHGEFIVHGWSLWLWEKHRPAHDSRT